MPETISGHGGLANTTLGTLTTFTPWPAWRRLASSDGTQVQLGDTYGALNRGGTGGIILTIAGIDPVIQFLLATRLKSTGQIWPVGFS
jgi:hypothetical protein